MNFLGGVMNQRWGLAHCEYIACARMTPVAREAMLLLLRHHVLSVAASNYLKKGPTEVADVCASHVRNCVVSGYMFAMYYILCTGCTSISTTYSSTNHSIHN